MSVTEDDAKSNPPTTSPTRRKFARKPSPLARCIKTAGDVNAGALLYQFVYRFDHRAALLEFEGNSWIAQTAYCWCEETGLTPKQYKRARRILQDKGLIEVTHAKVRPSHRWQTTYIRLADGLLDTLMVPRGTTASGPSKADDAVGPRGPDKLGKKPTGKKTEGKAFAPSARKGRAIKHRMKTPEGNNEENVERLVTKKDLEAVWRSAHEAVYPDWTPTAFAGSDWNDAHILIAKLGVAAPAMVDAAVANWSHFLTALERATGLYNQGSQPSLHKLATHADVALNWYRDESPPCSTDIDQIEEVYELPEYMCSD